MITTQVSLVDPDHCAGIHLNMPVAGPDSDTFGELTDDESAALERLTYYDQWDSAYFKQQSTRPQTLGYGLADSPVGQMCWIIEKFWSWTDCDGHPENVLSRDEMLDNVMFYWLTNTATSSGRLYWESARNTSLGEVPAPTACSRFPLEILGTSRRWAAKRFTDIRYWNDLEKGGHFAAFEQPEIFVDELRKAFAAIDAG
jgi:pimeloyl-ACP methyl ester carboxylesterase